MGKWILGLAAAAALMFVGTEAAQAQFPNCYGGGYGGYGGGYGYSGYGGGLYVSPYSNYHNRGVTVGYGNLGYDRFGGGYHSPHTTYRPSLGIPGGYYGGRIDPYHTYHRYPVPHVHHHHW